MAPERAQPSPRVPYGPHPLTVHTREVAGSIPAAPIAQQSRFRFFGGARADSRLRALQTIWGVGPILACHLLAEIGDARRFRRARQLVRAAGLDPVVIESADTKRRGRLSKTGSPSFAGRRSSKQPNMPAAPAAQISSSTAASANEPARNERP